jgi:hypothetical protein
MGAPSLDPGKRGELGRQPGPLLPSSIKRIRGDDGAMAKTESAHVFVKLESCLRPATVSMTRLIQTQEQSLKLGHRFSGCRSLGARVVMLPMMTLPSAVEVRLGVDPLPGGDQFAGKAALGEGGQFTWLKLQT